jgi:hypothetical protein
MKSEIDDANLDEMMREFRLTYYAYKHKRDAERFGLLEAVSYQDARRHPGRAFFIRTVFLPWHCMHLDREQKRKIVDEVFSEIKKGRGPTGMRCVRRTLTWVKSWIGMT